MKSDSFPLPATLLMTLALAGCSDDAPTATGAERPAEAAETAVVQVELSTAPINPDDAFGRTPPTIFEPGPCPFLSDQTAIATAKVRDTRPLLRRSASNEHCSWSYNRGFAVDVRIESVDTAKPLKERRYNLGVDAQLQQQDGPGSNAAVLLDSTWGKPRPYAYGFEINDQSVLIKVTGMSTDPESLRATANEVAARLPEAPAVEPSYRRTVEAFGACSIWSTDSIRSLFGHGDDVAVAAQGSRSYCTYKFSRAEYRTGENFRVDLGFAAFDKDITEKLVSKGARRVDGYPVPVLRETRTDEFGTNTALLAFMGFDQVSVNVMDQQGLPHDEALETLLNNVLDRLAQGGQSQ